MNLGSKERERERKVLLKMHKMNGINEGTPAPRRSPRALTRVRRAPISEPIEDDGEDAFLAAAREALDLASVAAEEPILSGQALMDAALVVFPIWDGTPEHYAGSDKWSAVGAVYLLGKRLATHPQASPELVAQGTEAMHRCMAFEADIMGAP